MNKYHKYLEQGSLAGGRYRFALPVSVARGMSGAHLGSAPGSSLEFMDHREYLPGDDLRNIDWGAYARSDKLAVKLFREEVNPHVDIIIDGSASMALKETQKDAAAVSLAALLATSAANSGYTHRAWTAGAICDEVANSNSQPRQWGELKFGFKGDPQQSFAKQSKPWRPRAVRIFISDLMWMGDPMTVMSHLSDGASLVIVIQLPGSVDIEPPQMGNIRLVDVETGQLHEVFVDEASRKRYRTKFANHQQNWDRVCKQLGALMFTVVAEDFLDGWQLDDLVKNEVLKIK